MAEPNKQNQDNPSYLPGDPNPDIEAKVDKFMKEEPGSSENSKEVPPQAPASTSAPLLPDDKLPDFDQKKPKDKLPQGPLLTNIKKSPEMPLPNNTTTINDEIGIESPKTNQAVDEIMAEEANRMLAIEDAKAELLAEGTAEIDKGIINRIKTKIAKFWANKKTRNASIAVVIIAILAVAMIPASRYFMLNTFGVRASISMRVVDDKTNQPLKNVEVSISGQSGKTDIDGKVKVEKIKLGGQNLTIKKPAFAALNQKIIIGWGSNPKGDVQLTAVGSRYFFELTDFLSGKPVADAEVTSGEASATANEKGEIALVVADQNETSLNVTISSGNYRSEKLNIQVGDDTIKHLKLVPAKKHVFVSKRSGNFDLYKIDVDGKNEEKVLAGTGAESEDKMTIMACPKCDYAAFVSTRGDKHNKDGFALSSLNVINLDDNKIDKIAESERIQLVDFVGTKLVFVKIIEGASAADPNRHRLISYDVITKEEKELASTNYFNDVMSAQGMIYYAPAVYKVNGTAGLYRINPDGSDRFTIYGQEVWNLFRVAYDKIDASVGQQWYEYNLSSIQFNKLSSAPPSLKSRVYADSPDGKKSAWVDERDGKGVLIIYDPGQKKDTVLQTQSGLKNPIYWLDDDHIVYRVSNNSETADFVISISGGSPKKIVDATDTAGLDRWYYY